MEPEIEAQLNGVRLQAHPDLVFYPPRGNFVYILEYKSVRKLRPEYWMQVSAYKAVVSRALGKPALVGVLLVDTLLTETLNNIPPCVRERARSVVYVELSAWDSVWEYLKGRMVLAEMGVRTPGPWCRTCVDREYCGAYRYAKTLGTVKFIKT